MLKRFNQHAAGKKVAWKPSGRDDCSGGLGPCQPLADVLRRAGMIVPGPWALPAPWRPSCAGPECLFRDFESAFQKARGSKIPLPGSYQEAIVPCLPPLCRVEGNGFRGPGVWPACPCLRQVLGMEQALSFRAGSCSFLLSS